MLRSFADLRTGDIVVHEDHGIARFAGFDTKTVAGVTRDYLYLEYAGSDRVFVPVDQLAKISRYVGAGGAHPPLSKLGGTRWETIKSRARRAAQELAGELLNLYAERKRREGHAFPLDTDWQREFEDAFPYVETPDQRDAIEFVKADMEAPRPMDRLICGDVGYGKTEVALRAAFKAVQDGKQVMLLVPTTILAQQHYGTFTERLKDYPVTIEHVSRFRPAAEQREAVARFSRGEVDILIGTHRLLSRDVRAKDLGLLIVDEEQRFGVKQKELLRQLKLKVDVISMSATPIPRTLQMSLAGVRDISVIETPPEGRRPIKTYVGEYDEELVRRALEREKDRGGQAFFLHNRVETIEETAVRLRGLCPGMRFEVAHGQMDERMLETADAVVPARRRRRARLHLDHRVRDRHPAGEHADRRARRRLRAGPALPDPGRVGRSRERAYAYLLYPSAAALTPEAAQRLSALSDYTELGAGFKIAMRDLEIRGAGNLLGDEQSGHVAALGFELYMQMLDEAVAAAARTAPASEDWEPVRLDVNVDAYVPADYIPYEQAKVDVHRRIAASREVADLVALREELEDRFGEPARAAAQPDRAAAGADQARAGGGEGGDVPWRAAGGHADRARFGPRQADPGRDPRGAVRVGQVAAVDARARRSGEAVPGGGAGGGCAAGGDSGGVALFLGCEAGEGQDVGEDGIWLFVHALVGDAEDAVAVALEHRVLDPVGFERAPAGVEVAPVELDDEAPLRPADVDQKARDHRVQLRRWELGALDEGVEVALELGAEVGSVAVVGEDLAELGSALRPRPPRHHPLHRPQVERPAPVGLLDGVEERVLLEDAGEVEDRPRHRGDGDAVDGGDVVGVEGAASGCGSWRGPRRAVPGR